MSVQDQIDEMTRRIVERFHPDRIILFGSHGRGDAAPDSDVDLLVLLDSLQSRRRKAVEIGMAVHDLELSADILVTTTEGFAWRKDVTGTIEYPAAHEGRVLYARA